MVFVVELPGEIIYGEVLLRMYGDREVLIENYKGILEYEEFYINPLESRPVWSNNREKLLILYKKTLSLGVLSKTHLRFEESECILYKD